MKRFTCPVCGNEHDELPALSFEGPAIFLAASPEEREADFEIGPDIGRFRGDEHFFIRALLAVPVHGWPENPLTWAVWATVSEDSYNRYKAVRLEHDGAKIGPMFGWIGNALPGYEDTLTLRSRLWPQNDRRRPLVDLEPTEHPLAMQQRDGVTLDYAMRYLHAHGGF